MLSEMKLLFLIALAYGQLQIDCPTIEQFNEIKKMVTHLTEQIHTRKAVSFNANQGKGQIPKKVGNIIPFGAADTKTIGFDSKRGIFSATVAGVYNFNFNLYRSKPLKSRPFFQAELVKLSKVKGKKEILCGAYSVQSYQTLGCTATTTLKPGDQVYVYLRKGGYYVHHYNNFSGVKIADIN